MENPTITIDNVKFTLLSKNDTADPMYEYIKIQSEQNQNQNTFYVYRSVSEGGIPRLACKAFNNNNFDKGKHYTVSTMIHPALIKFINENEASVINDESINLRIFKNIDIQTAIHSTPCVESMPGCDTYPIFNPLIFCEPGECINDFEYVISNFKRYVKQEKNDDAYYNSFSSILNRNLEKKEMKNMSAVEKLDAYLKSCSEYLQTHLMVPEKIEVTDYGTYMAQSPSFVVYNRYKSVVIVDKNSKKEYEVFYTIYRIANRTLEIINPNNLKYDPSYTLNLCMYPKTAKITKFGIFDRIIDTGSYCFKLMDYAVQFSQYARNAELSRTAPMRIIAKTGISKERQALIKKPEDLLYMSNYRVSYVWFGDVFNNLFPQNVLPPIHKSLADDEGQNLKFGDEFKENVEKNVEENVEEKFINPIPYVPNPNPYDFMRHNNPPVIYDSGSDDDEFFMPQPVDKKPNVPFDNEPLMPSPKPKSVDEFSDDDDEPIEHIDNESLRPVPFRLIPKLPSVDEKLIMPPLPVSDPSFKSTFVDIGIEKKEDIAQLDNIRRLVVFAHEKLDNGLKDYFDNNSLISDTFYKKVYDTYWHAHIREGPVSIDKFIGANIDIIKGMIIENFQNIVDNEPRNRPGNVSKYYENALKLSLTINLEADWNKFLMLPNDELSQCYFSCENPDKNIKCNCAVNCSFSNDWKTRISGTRVINGKNKYFCYPNKNSKYSLSQQFGNFRDSYKAQLYIKMLSDLNILTKLHTDATKFSGGNLDYYRKAKLDYLNLCRM